MNAIAVLTHTPHPKLVEFYKRFVNLGYDVFFVVDDNEFEGEDRAATFVHVDDAKCRARGFFNLNPAIKKESGCSAWDKALYYFCRTDTSYDNVWFIEDDVFVPRPETVSNIDRKYGQADIISQDCFVNERGALDLYDWFWWRFVPRHQLPLPWAASMLCAVRLSKKLLSTFHMFMRASALRLRLANRVMSVVNFLRRRQEQSPFPRKCFFIEYMFHTLALHNQLSIVTAHELRGISWRTEWAVTDMNVDCLYHPVKDITSHELYREVLADDRRGAAVFN